MGIPQSTRRLTEAESVAPDQAADVKSEFYDGEVFANGAFGSQAIRQAPSQSS